ncbi:hypothetical protein EC960109_1731, partial [Escherichia coli 96.0109]
MVYHESVTGRPARVRQNILISCDFFLQGFHPTGLFINQPVLLCQRRPCS